MLLSVTGVSGDFNVIDEPTMLSQIFKNVH